MLLHSQKGKTIETVKKNQLLSRAQSEGEGSEQMKHGIFRAVKLLRMTP